MEEQDILDMIDNDDINVEDDKPSIPAKANYNNKRENTWEKKDWKPRKIDMANFKKNGRSFAIYYNGENKTIPDDMQHRLTRIATALINKGYSFRHNAPGDDNVINSILEIPNISFKTYLPWSKFNSNIVKPLMSYANNLGYETACSISPKYLELPPALRAIIASECNAILGQDVNDPVDLILIYCDGGYEALEKNVDFKKIGNLGNIFRIAKDACIPVINIEKEDAANRVVELVKVTEKKD